MLNFDGKQVYSVDPKTKIGFKPVDIKQIPKFANVTLERLLCWNADPNIFCRRIFSSLYHVTPPYDVQSVWLIKGKEEYAAYSFILSLWQFCRVHDIEAWLPYDTANKRFVENIL